MEIITFYRKILTAIAVITITIERGEIYGAYFRKMGRNTENRQRRI